MTLLKKLIRSSTTLFGMEKTKLSRCALISDIDKGGLKMLDIESVVSARRVICLKKFLEGYPSTC